MLKNIILMVLVGGLAFAQTPKEILNENGCLSCHAIASKKLAPAFAGIAMKNKRFEGANAKTVIINSIKNGSKGKFRRFSNTEMPAFPSIGEKDLSILADYILSQSSKAKHFGQNHGGGMNRMGYNK